MIVQQLRINFDETGQPAPFEYLLTLVDSAKAEFGVALKGATTVNNNTDIDEGYTLELKIDLTGLGYPVGLGDKLLFMGVDLFDGDSFDDPLNDYGTRSWWFREHEGGPALAWMYLDPNNPIVGVENNASLIIPNSIELYGNYPNPFNPSTKIKFSIPEAGIVSIRVFNTIGEEVSSLSVYGNAGINEENYEASSLSTGIYFYEVSLNSSTAGKNYISKVGKMILLK